MKRYYQLVQLLIFFTYQISSSILCGSVDDEGIRKKRNVICSYGLTEVFIDVFYDVLEHTRKQDPLALNDAWQRQLHDGVLTGLSTLTNTTDVKVFCNEEDIIIFTTTLRMKNALIWYKWYRRIVFEVKLKGSVWMKAKEVDCDLEVRLNTTQGLKFTVTNSLITKMKNFEIGFKGLGALDPIVRKALKKSWKDKAPKNIGLLLKRTLESKLGRVARSLNWLLFW